MSADGSSTPGAASSTASEDRARLPMGDAPLFPALRRIARGDYARGAEIANGGMGRIVAAHDLRHDRPVAIKEMLRPSGLLAARFQREALITARLQHPSIIPVYEAGVWDDGLPVLVMKRVEGRSMEKVIANRPLRDRLALIPNVIAVTEALAYAHARGVIHRDLKPHNVLVGNYGETVVIDWGLAKTIDATADVSGDAQTLPPDVSPTESNDLTAAGQALGTPAYMAPEQATGASEVDARADVYALGAILYHVLSGRMPRPALSPGRDLPSRVAATKPEPLDALGLDLPPELVAIAMKAMAERPEDRYPSASELAQDLERFIDGQLVGAHRYSLNSLVRRWASRHRVGLAALGALAIAGGVALVLYVRAINAEQRATDQARREAVENLELARVRTRSLLEEQGRSRLLVREAPQALAYLSESYTQGNASPALRYMIARAFDQIGEREILAAPWPSTAQFTAGANLLVASDDGVRVIDPREDRAIAHVGTKRPFVSIASDRRTAALRWVSGEGEVIDLATGRRTRLLDPVEGTRGFAMVGELFVTATSTTLELADVNRVRWKVPRTGVDQRQRHDVFASPDGRRVSACASKYDGAEASCTVHDETGKELRRIAGTLLDVNAGLLLAGATAHDLVTGIDVVLQEPIVPIAGTLDRTNRRLALVAQDLELSIWDLRTGKRTHQLGTGGAFPTFDPSGRYVLACVAAHRSAEPSLRMWDVELGILVGELPVSTNGSVGVSPDGTAIVVSSPFGPPVTTSVERLRRSLVAVERGLAALAIAPDGAHLAIAKPDGVYRIDATTGARMFAGDAGGAATALAYAPDGRRLALAMADHVAVIDLASRAITRIAVANATRVTWPFPDRLLVQVARRLHVTDPSSGTVTAVIPRYAGTVLRDGRIVAAGSSLELWDAAGREATLISPGGLLWVDASDAGVVAFGGTGRSIQLWDSALIGSARVLKTLEGRLMSEASGGITRDGTLVVSGAAPLHVWDPATGRLLFEHPNLDGYASHLAISHDGSRVVTASPDGVIRRWELSLERRSPTAVADEVRRVTRWSVDEAGQLVARPR